MACVLNLHGLFMSLHGLFLFLGFGLCSECFGIYFVLGNLVKSKLWALPCCLVEPRSQWNLAHVLK